MAAPQSGRNNDPVKDLVKKVAQGAYSVDLKQYSKLTGYAWGAFVGAAGLAFGLTQLLNLGKPAQDAQTDPAEGQAAPSSRAKSTSP